MKEVWKEIPGYDGAYEVSNKGRVRKTIILKTDGGGHKYQRVNLDGKTNYVHRLVATAFLGEPPFEGAVVNHKDFDTRNNTAENLEWVTQRDNVRHATILMAKPKRKCRRSNTGHKYIYVDRKGGYVVSVRQLGLRGRFKTIDEAVAFRDLEMKRWRENAFCADE